MQQLTIVQGIDTITRIAVTNISFVIKTCSVFGYFIAKISAIQISLALHFRHLITTNLSSLYSLKPVKHHIVQKKLYLEDGNHHIVREIAFINTINLSSYLSKISIQLV